MRINHNIAALNTYRQLGVNQGAAGKNLEKLSSGLRINRAGDDAAGLAISEKMRGQIRGLEQAQRNSQDAISLIQTAEGALNETHSILQRMKELATQAANDTYADTDRAEIQKEINQLTSEINRIGNTTEFNTKKLLNGDISSTSGIVTADNLANAGSTALSDLALDKKSALDAGNYEIVIADNITKSGTHTADTEVTGVTVAANSSLEGDYRINITQGQAKGATLDTTPDAVTSVAINPLSSEADGTHTIEITRTDSVAAGGFTGANTGLDADGITTDGSVAVSGTYTVTTSAVASAIANGTAAASNFLALSIDDPGALANDTGYRLAYVEESTGIFSVQLQDNAGVAISEKVILDNGQQNYNFKAAGSPATDLGISFTTVTGVNTALAAEDGNYNEFSVSTQLELSQGGTSLGTATVAAGAAAGTATIAGFEIAHDSANLVNGESDTFTVTNTLTATFNGADTQTFTAGNTVNFANGVSIGTDADISLYGIGTAESYSVTIDTTDTYLATVETDLGAAVAGSQTVAVSDGGTYNLGNGVEFTVGTLAGDTTHDFTVNAATTTSATLTNTTTHETKAVLNNIAAGTLNFGNGLTVAAATTGNGTATFEISGAVEDKSLSMQVGANQGQGFTMHVTDMRAAALGIAGTQGANHENVADAKFTNVAADVTNGTNNNGQENALDVSSHTAAAAAIKVLDNAINTVSSERSKLGAYQNRLDHTINNLGASAENLTAAESRIRDVDMAKEMMEFTKNNILTQAAQAMLAQANQQPQGVLQLLR